MVKKISEKEFNEVKESKLAVIDFSAQWCGPCKMLAPILEDVSKELDGKVAFFNVDVDEAPALSNQFAIQNIPSLVVFKDGEKVDMQVGFQPRANLLQFINAHL